MRETLMERLIMDLVMAQVNEWSVSIDYLKKDGTRTRRVIKPTEVFYAPSTNKFCVKSYDGMRQEPRTFRLDRIRAYSIHRSKMINFEPLPVG